MNQIYLRASNVIEEALRGHDSKSNIFTPLTPRCHRTPCKHEIYRKEPSALDGLFEDIGKQKLKTPLHYPLPGRQHVPGPGSVAVAAE